MLRVQISRLRQALAGGRPAAGREALGHGDPGQAAALLAEAEALWRGNGAQRRNTTWSQLTRPGPLRHYADLRKCSPTTSGNSPGNIDAGRRPAK
jgi:hypothetical protein